MSLTSLINKEQVYQWLSNVTDPEVPVLTILDLGIVRDVKITEENDEANVTVVMTPTYSGCPALDAIVMNTRMTLTSYGIKHLNIELQLSPAWTTDWMTEEGKKKLKEYGIAPPQRKAFRPLGLFEEDDVTCPHCGSSNTKLVSQFGATSCKALYSCLSCLEPFEHFKCH